MTNNRQFDGRDWLKGFLNDTNAFLTRAATAEMGAEMLNCRCYEEHAMMTNHDAARADALKIGRRATGWGAMTHEQLVAIIEKIEAVVPAADDTCSESGITFPEAVRRHLIDAQHPAFRGVR